MQKQFVKDQLPVMILDDRDEMGAAAGRSGAEILRRLLSARPEVNVMFAAAPSQNEVLAYLRDVADLPYNRVNAFHMDEYVGLSPDAPQGFGNFLRDRLFDALPFKSVHYIGATTEQDAADAANAYAALLRTHPIDLCFMGIGENGHIAFNDPGVADFNDPSAVKLVALDEKCRLQQVHDGCFAALSDVPTHALTVTIPALFGAAHIVCTVPAKTKANAVRRMLTAPISPDCPASILRKHAAAALYLDPDAASLL